ncbi:hypothetical protein A6M27_06145 [Acidithiobacillus thiooxidans]|uniref:VWFA domain-containing protein n=1 Tax=Acidithiobacillus thiooxidans TaxID=930 RepID=A0A1C2HY58_ACITH|nr:VWA domain-containing protein [Acidithiobacillus thiooxidans]OCX67813.1 hypothetical protein A6O24_20490 [Acidithiobacillus thiooxidans]OCX68620.1 hypothetical protein A6P07_17840 [Acidithiobacillus thiooxidans]OCX82225.1 hypothetical protein A6O26_10620 [Acidithiobacillus thiooxidans]OCX88725.1 hypothetical protein A6M27_06145 [Acidithiobacillus thiooxidans]OFC50187.1 hypothetical protein BAE47_02295 [Acidithiobacillus thiooxidans]
MTINIKKAEEKAGIHLQKHGLDPANAPKMRVGICLDVSGSMSDEYHEGHVQEALGHLMGLASHIDESQKMDVFLFHNHAMQCRHPINRNNAESYVDREIIHGGHSLWGGTEYSPVIHKAYEHYFPEMTHLHTRDALSGHHEKHGGFLSGLFHKHSHDQVQAPASIPQPTSDPVLMLFLTDGECSDESHTIRALEAGKNLPLFWAFVGIGHHSRLLREFAEESDAEFVNLPHIRVDDDALFSAVISSKLANWLKQF